MGLMNSLKQDYIFDGSFKDGLKDGYGELITPFQKYSGKFKEYKHFIINFLLLLLKFLNLTELFKLSNSL